MKKMKRLTALVLSGAMILSVLFGAMSFASAAGSDAVEDLKKITATIEVKPGDTTGNLTLTMQGPDNTAAAADKCTGAAFTAYPLVKYELTGTDITGYELANKPFWTDFGVNSVNDLQAKLKDEKFATKLATALSTYTGTLTDGVEKTVSDSKAVFNGLPFGFYYVDQTTASGTGLISSAPILVNLPYSEGTGDNINWYTNLEAYAKTTLPTVKKQILNKADTTTTIDNPSDPGTGNTWQDETNQSAGTTAYFRVEIDFPQYKLLGMTTAQIEQIKLQVADTMPANLSFNDDVAVKYIVAGDPTENTLPDNYKVTKHTVPEDKKFDVDFTGHYAAIQALGDVKKLVIYYSAEVKSGIAVGTSEDNAVEYTYSNDMESVTESKPGTTTTSKDKTVLWTYGVTIDKFNKKNNTAKLAGAAFTITDKAATPNTYWFDKTTGTDIKVMYVGTPTDGDTTYYTDATFNDPVTGPTNFIKITGVTLSDGTTGATIYNTVVSNADGKVQVSGLDAGDYTLTETEAPQGYNKLTAPLTLTITAAKDEAGKLNGKVTDSATEDNGDSYKDIGVANESGITLPSTGGVGTILFTVIGLALILGCVAFVVVKKSKEKYSN